GGSNVGDIKEFFWKWRRHHQPKHQDSLARWEHNLTLPNKPGMNSLGIFGATVTDDLDALGDNLVRFHDFDARSMGGMGGAPGGSRSGRWGTARGSARAKPTWSPARI